MKKLIQVHSEEPQRKWCSRCDSYVDKDTNIWYKIQDPQNHIEMYQVYLECCLDKVGIVVDWEEKNEFTKKI